MPNYVRTLAELKNKAIMFWPDQLVSAANEESIIPKLLETQDQFISILKIDVPDIDCLFNIINNSTLSGNMFLKHLAVLSNIGGEKIQRINSQFNLLFPEGKIEYYWKGIQKIYSFIGLPVTNPRTGKAISLTNSRLKIDKSSLLTASILNDEMKDILVIMLFGSTSSNDEVARLMSDAQISPLLGQPDELEKYLRQRYIQVSRITQGGTANDLGHITEEYICDYLEQNIGINGITIVRDGTVPGVTQRGNSQGGGTTFDIVVSNGIKYVAIEVTFQVTTNSVIERKAGQASDRYQQINSQGQKIAYVIDGAGNLGGSRDAALNIICQHSHCTVAFRDEEFDVLCSFIREFFSDPTV